MATKRGCLGVVTISATTGGSYVAIGELTDWNFDETSEQIDASAMGACTKKFVAGAKATTGNVATWWDADDTIQALVIVGNTIHMKVYPEGVGSGSNFYKTPLGTTGGAVVIKVARAGGGVDGIVTQNFDFTVNGQMTATAVA